MTRKRLIGTEDLFVLLDRDYRKLRPPGCELCNVTLPFRVQDGAVANWMVDTTGLCPLPCAAVLEDLMTRYQAQYDLRP